MLEAEPNDDVTQAQFLGTFVAGQSITVLGNITDTNVSDADPFDGFQLDAPATPIFITATLDHDVAHDFDFFLYDPVAGLILQTFDTTDVPEVGMFTISGPFQLVIYSFAGSGDYTFDIVATPAQSGLAGGDRGAGPRATRTAGALYPEVSRTLASGSEGPERFLVTLPYMTHLEARLVDPVGGPVEVILRDATLDPRSPLESARFELADGLPSKPVLFPAHALVEVELRSLAGADACLVELSARAAPATTARGRLTPLAAEVALARGPAGAYYGRPSLRCMPGQVLVQPRAGFDAQHELELAGAHLMRTVGVGAWKVGFDLDPTLDEEDRQRVTFAVARALNARPAFEYAEPNLLRRRQGVIVPNDPFYNLQWHYPQIQLPAAWDLTVGSAAVTVAVIDTGSTPHPDLVNRTVAGYDMISDIANAGDGDGRDGDPTDPGNGNGITPDSYHGTHVAGTIAAETNNNVGVSGVTWVGNVQHVRVLGVMGFGSDADIADAILWAAGLPVANAPSNATPSRVLNLSLGGPGFNQTTQNAVTAARNAGSVVVAAAGNCDSPNLFYPASYNDVVSVSAVDLNSAKAPYSNFNPMVDIAGPGGDTSADLNGDGYVDGVLSTLFDTPAQEFIYKFYQGTSMAAPHIAGVVALMIAANPGQTPAQIENQLFATATDLGEPGHDDIFGHGLVNAYQAVLAAQGGGGGQPVLSLSSQSLSLSNTQTSANVQIANVGGGLLTVSAPTVSTQSGGNWLSATLIPVGSPTTTTASTVQVSGTLTGLADGNYVGNVNVPSDGGSLPIQVLLSISTGTTLDIDIFVLAVELVDFTTVAQVIVNPTTGLVWEMADVPVGTYLIVAGSDDDDDLFICGPGDLYCGAFPTLNAPTIVTKSAGVELSNLNFTVATSFQGLNAGASQGYQRLE